MKIKCKLADNYSKLGEIPGVLVDKVARQKIMKELGQAQEPNQSAQADSEAAESDVVEEAKAE